MKKLLGVFIVIFVWCETNSFAEKKAASVAASPSGRSKSLSFEDSLVEGMNRNPLDSLEHVAKKDGRKINHLYRKRIQFRKEIQDTVDEMGYMP